MCWSRSVQPRSLTWAPTSPAPTARSVPFACVVSGIDFLGAGVILADGTSIRGLNTAATLWCSAAIETFAGAGLPGEAVAVTAFVLAGNTPLRPLVNWVNRRSITESETGALYLKHATCGRNDLANVRDLLDEVQSRFHYPIRQIDACALSESENQVELAAGRRWDAEGGEDTRRGCQHRAEGEG